MRMPSVSTWVKTFAAYLFPVILLSSLCIPVSGVSSMPSTDFSGDKHAKLLLSNHLNELDPEDHSTSPGLLPPQPNLNDPPLTLTFPTPDPPPAFEWRPPLYEAPWALNPHDHFYFTRPIAIDKGAWLVDDYRYGDLYPETDIIHTGIDIVAQIGTPILAVASGEVVWTGEGLAKNNDLDEDPYGLAVVILHDFGFNQQHLETVYAHMNRIDVTVGQLVNPGDQLGIVGITGRTSGPHLHFEVRIEEGDFYPTRNPELWLVPPQGWGVLAGRLMKKDGTPFYNLEVIVRSLDSGKTWKLHTYSPTHVNSDDYYQENFVLSDLPAGDYEVKFKYFWISETINVTILPGVLTYFTFRNTLGASFEMPQPLEADSPFIPAPVN